MGGQYFRTDPSQVTRAQGTAKSRALKSAETQAKRLAKTAGLNPATVQLVEVTPIGAQTGGFATRSLALESVSRGGSADQQTNLTVNKQDVSAGLQAVFTASTGRLQPFPGPIGPIRPLHQADGQQ